MNHRLSALMLSSILMGTLLTGCGPTYRADRIVDEVQKLNKKEYDIDADVKMVGNTLIVRILVDNLMGVLLSGDSAEGKKVWDSMTVLSRVCLSTDAPIQFFVVVAADRAEPSNSFVFTRYVEDVKRVMLDDISRGEFLDQTLIEMRFRAKVFSSTPPSSTF